MNIVEKHTETLGEESKLDPLYLDGNDVRLTVVTEAKDLPNDMPIELKEYVVFKAIMEQAPDDYCCCETGYLIDQVLFNYTFYVIFVKKESVIKLVKPALDEGREVIVGDIDKKEFSISPGLYEKGFRRSKKNYYRKGGGWKNVKGKVYSRLAWADKRFFI